MNFLGSCTYLLFVIALARCRAGQLREMCDEPNIFYLTKNSEQKTYGVIQQGFQLCCRSNSSKLTWFYEGEEHNLLKNWTKMKCRKRNCNCIFNKYLTRKVSGQYECRGSSVGIRKVHLKVLGVKPNCEGPQDLEISSSKTLALVGEEVEWKCKAFVGELRSKSNHSMKFIKIKSDSQDSDQVLEQTSHTFINVTLDENGILIGSLHIKNIHRGHMGNYTCVVTKFGHQKKIGFILEYGVPSHLETIGNYRMILLIIVSSIGVVFFCILAWHQSRLIFALSRARTKCIEDALYDIAIIHGHDSQDWVIYHLLPVIEYGAKFTCFVPSRDMVPGLPIGEQIGNSVPNCRLKLIILSKNLLECEWAKLALYTTVSHVINGRAVSPIILSLHSPKKIVCEQTKDLNMMKHLLSFPIIPIPSMQLRLKSIENIKIIIDKVFKPTFSCDCPLDHEAQFTLSFNLDQNFTPKQINHFEKQQLMNNFIHNTSSSLESKDPGKIKFYEDKKVVNCNLVPVDSMLQKNKEIMFGRNIFDTNLKRDQEKSDLFHEKSMIKESVQSICDKEDQLSVKCKDSSLNRDSMINVTIGSQITPQKSELNILYQNIQRDVIMLHDKRHSCKAKQNGFLTILSFHLRLGLFGKRELQFWSKVFLALSSRRK